MLQTNVSSIIGNQNFKNPFSKTKVTDNFKVGTLDTLILLSDELAKADAYGESVVRKVANYTLDVLDGNKQQMVDNLTLANNIKPNRKQ